MKLNELKFENSQFGKRMNLLAVEPYFKYKDNKKTDEIEGYKYSVVLLDKEYEKLDIKIAGNRQVEELEKYDIPVKFNNLEVTFYQDFTTKNLHLKATAKSIEMLKQ